MERQAFSYLEQWLIKSDRKPLVIRGARQVGKTELVRLFCQQKKLDLIEINLEEKTISEFEKEKNFDVERAIGEILALTNKKIGPNSLLFIDEIQSSVKTYSRLRFFKEQRPELPLIAAGSLLEVMLKRENLSAPVGRIEYMFLGPMTFGEFLLANGRDILFSQLSNINWETQENPIPKGTHEELEEIFKQYLFVGGMPEAVKRFVKNRVSYNDAREVHTQIIESYREDIRKYSSGKLTMVLNEVFEKFPARIGEKTKFSALSDEKSTYVSEAIDTLNDVYILQKVFHSNCSGLPLASGENPKLYKLFHLDVGLYNAQMGVKWQDFSPLDGARLMNKGRMVEQFVAQHLNQGRYKVKKEKLHYWFRDRSSTKAEVDFVIDTHGISPIEVKAGKTGTMKSLLQFMEEKQTLVPSAVRFDLNHREKFQEEVRLGMTTGSTVEFKLRSYPVYAAEFVFQK